MSVISGVPVTNENLLFAVDLTNNKKSNIGKPTTNFLPNPSSNGRFRTTNSWGTYNTNQYGSGTFFSIGTVASVSGNIVTMTAAHTLRTYDAMQPQTTGGGVTAGTTYFIKKISATQFSLHAYNGTENGSQGFLNPATGTHTVHNSIALDQRISINATSFPTSWWGPPHLPNTCHVKEIVENGGYEPNTPCMRIHVTRTTGVDGGMAYGVDTPVTAGDVITVSFWHKANGSAGVGVAVGYTTYFGPSAGAFNSSFTPSASWQKTTFTWTASATYSFIQYFFPPASSAPYSIDMADLQVERNAGAIAGSFTENARSTSQAVLDTTGLNTVTMVGSPTYNTNNITFPNINSAYLDVTPATNLRMGLQSFTISSWIKQLDNGSNCLVEARGAGLVGYFFILNYPAAGQVAFFVNNAAGQQIYSSARADLPTGVIQNVTAVINRSAASVIIYVNGEAWATLTTSLHTSTITPASGDIYRIGTDQGGGTQNYELYAHQHYLKALSADEVRQTYNLYRGKFGL